MLSQATTETTQRSKMFMDIPTAAGMAGFSLRHFRRIIEEDRIPVMQIGRKYFIVARDLEEWKSTRGEARLDAAIQQLDGWLKTAPKSSTEPINWDDEDFG